MTGNRTALVLGATGGIGIPVARLLAARGWTVRALHRDPRRVESLGPFDWIQGDAMVPADVERAARGVPVIVHAVKPRHYIDWQKFVLPMIDNTIAAAQGARIVVPGNVYNYGPDAGLVIPEEAPQNPDTDKGRLRVEMERRIADAVDAGRAKALIVRAGDFFGPGAGSSWFSGVMVKPGPRPDVVLNPGTAGVGHQWVYLPDLAETLVQLIEHEALPDFARFHMDGHWDPDGARMAGAIVRALGSPEATVQPLPWKAMSLQAAVVPELNELMELRRLWEQPVRLSNETLVATLGSEPHTPMDDAVRQTIEAMNFPPAPAAQTAE